MKSIICGAGEVGKSIAEKLSKEGFEITVIDESKEQLKRIGGGHLLNEVSRDKVDVERVSKKMEKSKLYLFR